MEKFKGTPGPWIKRVTEKGAILVSIPKKFGERVIYTDLHLGKIYDDDCGVETCCKVEEHCNARLIAAAPELLEVLQKMVDNYWIGVDFDLLEEAEQVIKKALG